MQNRLNLNPTDFVPLARCSFDTISVYLCLPVSVGLQLRLKGKAGVGELCGGGGGLNTIIGSIVQAGPAAPGPELSSQLTPCQFWLETQCSGLVTALSPRHPALARFTITKC